MDDKIQNNAKFTHVSCDNELIMLALLLQRYTKYSLVYLESIVWARDDCMIASDSTTRPFMANDNNCLRFSLYNSKNISLFMKCSVDLFFSESSFVKGKRQ